MKVILAKTTNAFREYCRRQKLSITENIHVCTLDPRAGEKVGSLVVKMENVIVLSKPSPQLAEALQYRILRGEAGVYDEKMGKGWDELVEEVRDYLTREVAW